MTRLLATEQTSGPEPACSGPRPSCGNYYAGGYQQGLALAALAAAGVKGPTQVGRAITWLVDQQCPDGGWTMP